MDIIKRYILLPRKLTHFPRTDRSSPLFPDGKHFNRVMHSPPRLFLSVCFSCIPEGKRERNSARYSLSSWPVYRATANCYYNYCSLYRINTCSLTCTMTPAILKGCIFFAKFHRIHTKGTDFTLKFLFVTSINTANISHLPALIMKIMNYSGKTSAGQ